MIQKFLRILKERIAAENLKKERKDQSGAITKGADLSNEQVAQIINFLKIKDLKKLIY